MIQNTQFCPFVNLPIEILYHILSYLPEKRGVCRGVCRTWREATNGLIKSEVLYRIKDTIPESIQETMWNHFVRELPESNPLKTIEKPNARVKVISIAVYQNNCIIDIIKKIASTVKNKTRDYPKESEDYKKLKIIAGKLNAIAIDKARLQPSDYELSNRRFLLQNHQIIKCLNHLNVYSLFNLREWKELLVKINFDDYATLSSSIQQEAYVLTQRDCHEIKHVSLKKTCSDFPFEYRQMPNLSDLDLSNNNLIFVPTQLPKFSLLTDLSLSHNCLTELPEDFSSLTELENLYLSHNQFTQFPSVILKLKKLTVLEMANNLLAELPEELAQTQLKTISLKNNRFTSPPAVLQKMENLVVSL